MSTNGPHRTANIGDRGGGGGEVARSYAVILYEYCT